MRGLELESNLVNLGATFISENRTEPAKIKDMARMCIGFAHDIFDILYYEELPKFKKNDEKAEEGREENNNSVPPFGHREGDNIIPSHSVYTALHCCMLLMEKYFMLQEKYSQEDLRNLRVKAEQGINGIMRGKWRDYK
jgi:hypothetical protein